MADRAQNAIASSAQEAIRAQGSLQQSQELMAQMCQSNAAYDRMTLQVEQTAAELRALVSPPYFKCLAEISAANQRAAEAESELTALRAKLRVQSAGCWLQNTASHYTACSPDKSRVASTHFLSQPNSVTNGLQSVGAVNASGPPADAGMHSHVLEEALKHSKDELDCAKRNRVALDVRISGQDAEIRRLQQSLAAAQEQVVNVHSMCNTAYCNHVRSIVARIERALLPAQSLVEMLQPLQGNQLHSASSNNVDIDLKALLESKEWSARDWERVEDASVHWLDKLHAILSSCASGVKLLIEEQVKLQEIEQAAASTLAHHAETACSRLNEIHQQQVISMREAAEAARRVEHIELELQEQQKEAAIAAEARDALEQAQHETLRSLHAAEMRARQAETSCSQLRSQLQFIASENRRAAAEQERECEASHLGTADSGVTGVLDSCQSGQQKERVSASAGVEGECHEDHVQHLPDEAVALPVPPNQAFRTQGAEQLSEVSLGSKQQQAQLGDTQSEQVGSVGGGEPEPRSRVAHGLPQGKQHEEHSQDETARMHPKTDEGAITAVKAALHRLSSAVVQARKGWDVDAEVTDNVTDIVLHCSGQGQGDGVAVASSGQEWVREVTHAVDVCSVALQQAFDARQTHEDAQSRAHAAESAALSESVSELSLQCREAEQRADAACAEKEELAHKLTSTQGALESTEAMVLDLQMRLGHTEERCRQHEAAARSSSELSDTTQKLLLVAEARAAEAENQVACYQENAAKSSKAMLLAHIRADDAENALTEEEAEGSAREDNSSHTQNIISQPQPASDISSVMDSGLDVAPSVHSVAVMTPDAQPGSALHWAVARVAKLMGRHDIHKAEILPQDAVLAIQELDMHVVHVENVRALAEDVIIRAKERILAHSKEQKLEIPVVVAERNSVAVEDVASMLDQILITSSNNADDVCDLQAALTTAKSDAASLRKELELLESRLAASTASEASASEQKAMEQELETVQQALESSKRDTAAAAAQLVSLRQLHEEHAHASAAEQDDLVQQVEVLQQTLLLTEAKADAVSAELSMVREQLADEGAHATLQSQQEAEEEVRRLHTDLEHAEEREDGLLLQVQTLEQTVQELVAVQAEAPSEVATSADPDLKGKLQSVEQNLEQLTAQLAEAQDSVERSNETALEAHTRSEQLERELGEASSIIVALETSVNMLSTQAAEQIDSPNSDPESRHGRSSVSQEGDGPQNAAGQGSLEQQHSDGEQLAADARNVSDTMEDQQGSQESTERAYSPASDWRSETSFRDEELKQALDRTTAAESRAAALEEERNHQEGVLLQLMDDIGTLQSQLDELQAAKIQREDGWDAVQHQQDEVSQLREQIKELQETVASANKDLHLAESHAKEMQESLQEHERSKESMMEVLKQKLLTLQQAQETLESDFKEIRSERDQALADLQLLAEHCGNILEERGVVLGEPVKWRQPMLGTNLEQKMAESVELHQETELIKAERH